MQCQQKRVGVSVKKESFYRNKTTHAILCCYGVHTLKFMHANETRCHVYFLFKRSKNIQNDAHCYSKRNPSSLLTLHIGWISVEVEMHCCETTGVVISLGHARRNGNEKRLNEEYLTNRRGKHTYENGCLWWILHSSREV